MLAGKAASIGLAVVLLGGCVIDHSRAGQSSIGTAEISSDGVLTLRLSSYERDGAHVQGSVTYLPGDPHYDEVVTHLDGIAPGEVKPAPPWTAGHPPAGRQP